MIIANCVVPDPETEERHRSTPEAVGKSSVSVFPWDERTQERTRHPCERLQAEVDVSCPGF